MKANRDLRELAEPFQSFLKKALLELPEIFVTEGYRSQERQNELYAQGRDSGGRIVTWTLKSLHTKRKACDIAFHGSELYPKDINKWNKVFDVMAKHNINSGYRMWGRDLAHLQYQGDVTPDKSTKEFLSYNKSIMTEDERVVYKNKQIQALASGYSVLWGLCKSEEDKKSVALIKEGLLAMSE